MTFIKQKLILICAIAASEARIVKSKLSVNDIDSKNYRYEYSPAQFLAGRPLFNMGEITFHWKVKIIYSL